MQRRNLFGLLLLAGLALAHSSCDKDDGNEKGQSRMDLLTTGQWRMTAFSVSPAIDFDYDGDTDSDVLATFEPCHKDDYTVFKADGKAELNEGPTKCDALDPQVEYIDWAFVNGEKEIIIDGDRCTIVELSGTRFRVTLPLMGARADILFTR